MLLLARNSWMTTAHWDSALPSWRIWFFALNRSDYFHHMPSSNASKRHSWLTILRQKLMSFFSLFWSWYARQVLQITHCLLGTFLCFWSAHDTRNALSLPKHASKIEHKISGWLFLLASCPWQKKSQATCDLKNTALTTCKVNEVVSFSTLFHEGHGHG